MFAIEVDLLTGRYTATRHDDRDAHEWPPHPGRLFSALVAVWGDDEDPGGRGRAALEWLERQDPPSVSASEISIRVPGTHYVPDNDVAAVRDLSRDYHKVLAATRAAADGSPKEQKTLARALTAARSAAAKASVQGGIADTALRILPEQRSRQGRSYPTVRPVDPLVTYIWTGADAPDDIAAALDDLLARLWRLGHSLHPRRVPTRRRSARADAGSQRNRAAPARPGTRATG